MFTEASALQHATTTYHKVKRSDLAYMSPLTPTQAAKFNSFGIVNKTQDWVDSMPKNVWLFFKWKSERRDKTIYFTNTDEISRKTKIWDEWVLKCTALKNICDGFASYIHKACIGDGETNPYADENMLQYEPSPRNNDSYYYEEYMGTEDLNTMVQMGSLQSITYA